MTKEPVAVVADLLFREEVVRARAMAPEDKLLEGPRLFERACRVMIVGSLASNFHGIPRATRDADFLIQLGSASIADLAAALPDDLGLESQAAFEAVTGTMRYLVTLRHSPFVCELFLCGDDPYDTARFRRRERVLVDSAPVSRRPPPLAG